MATNRLQVRLDAVDNTKRAFSSIKSSIFSLKGALAGLGIGLAVREFVKTGRSVEDLNVRLKQLFGSTQEGAKAFDVMSKFAGRVPFSLEEIQAASGNLAVVAGNADNLSEILEITGNVAAVTGLDFRTAGEQIQRSFAGGIAAADIFREKGVRDMLGFKAGATVTAEETIEAFQKVFGKGGRFGKATDELANTFTGTLSMLGDKLFNFKTTVAGEGFFDALKKEFQELNKFVEENSETFKDIGKAISKVLTLAVKAFSAAIRGVANAVSFLKRQVEAIQRLLGFDVPLVVEIKKAKEETVKLNSNLIKTKTLAEETLEKIQQQNQKFSLSTEIVKQVNVGVKGVSQGIAEAVVLGKNLNDSFRQLAQRILVNVISRMIERRILLLIEVGLEKRKTAELTKQLGLMKTMSLLARVSGVTGFLGKVFGTVTSTGIDTSVISPFAEGGNIKAGQPALVGERGRELFVPNTDGRIIKNEDLGMGANITFNINAVDVRGVQELLIENRSTITNLVNQALNQQGRKALV